MTTDQIIGYYRDLLIMQYAAQPRARKTTEAFVAAQVADQVVTQVRDGFNLPSQGGGLIDSARGKQLETLASYRGLARLVYGLSRVSTYFEMPGYGDGDADTRPGFRNYGDVATLDLFLTYGQAAQPLYSLSDAELIRLVQLKALSQRNWTVAQVDAILYAVFGDRVGVFENSPMDITYAAITGDTDTLFDIAVLVKALPRPAGVVLHTDRIPMLAGEFGFQYYGVALDPAFVGFGIYGTPLMGSFMRYF
jgi:hypothetical protein